MHSIKKIMGSATLAALMLMPLAASADTIGAHAGTGVFIATNGIVRVIGAEVASISGNVVSAVTSLGGVLINWNVTATSTTKVIANGSASSTVADIHVGDKIGFVGTALSTSSPFFVTASKIRDITTSPVHTDNDTGHKNKGKHRGWNNGKGKFLGLLKHFKLEAN